MHSNPNSDKYRNTYRIPPARLQTWNYASEAAYFVTICTKNRRNYFGNISGGQIEYATMGSIARQEWLRTPGLRADMNIQLDEFVLMPNHFHAIVIIGANDYNGRDSMHRVSTPPVNANAFGPQRKNLGSIIRGFKSSVTTYARKNNIEFDWQERFHDHVIRNDVEHERIKNYIKNNVVNWKGDKFYAKNES